MVLGLWVSLLDKKWRSKCEAGEFDRRWSEERA